MKIQITVKKGDIIWISEVIYCDPTQEKLDKVGKKILDALKELGQK